MLTYAQVSYVLLFIWGGYFFLQRKGLQTLKPYFFLLFFMAFAGIVLPERFIITYSDYLEYSFVNTLVFALLLISMVFPWCTFNSWHCKVAHIQISSKSIGIFKISFITMILMSVYSMLYALPYAIQALSMGADEVRTMILETSLYPKNIFTTICVGVGCLTPIQILMFFFSLLDTRLSKYSLWLFISSLTYIVTNLPNTGRDGMIYIPLMYIFLFQIFKPYLEKKMIDKIKRYFILIIPILCFLIFTITMARFYMYGKNPIEGLIQGTWGYFYQQPYVFDNTLNHMDKFRGLSAQFPLLAKLLGIYEGPLHYSELEHFEYSFGTMYSQFYTISGWSSLIVCALFFVVSFNLLLYYLIRRKKFTSLFIVFSVYLYYVITGLFYYRLKADNIVLLNLFIFTGSLFLKNYLIISYKRKL